MVAAISPSTSHVKESCKLAQLRDRQIQQAGLALHPFGFVTVSPTHPQPSAAPVVLAPQKCRRFLLNGYLQNVACQRPHKSTHRCLSGCSLYGFAAKQLLDLFLHLQTRWYSLHGVDLLPAPLPRSLLWFVSPG